MLFLALIVHKVGLGVLLRHLRILLCELGDLIQRTLELPCDGQVVEDGVPCRHNSTANTFLAQSEVSQNSTCRSGDSVRGELPGDTVHNKGTQMLQELKDVQEEPADKVGNLSKTFEQHT